MRRATRRYRASFVGLGTMGMRHARVFEGLPDRFEVLGGYDVRSDLELPPGLRRFRSEEEATEHADVIVVATPNAAHAGAASRALVAGKHVLVEKPLCASAAEAEALARLAGRGSAWLFVGHSERFNPVAQALVRLLRGDEVAAIDMRRVGRSRPTGCGALVNLGVHDFDLAAYWTGGPLAVHAALGHGGSGDAGEDSADVLFTTAGGAVGHLHVDRTSPVRRREIVITTERWLYEGDLLAHRLLRTQRSTGARSEVPLPLAEPLALQALALADALDGHAGHASHVGERPPRPERERTAKAEHGMELATGVEGAEAVALAERAAELVAFDPFESRPREKLAGDKRPLLPRR